MVVKFLLECDGMLNPSICYNSGAMATNSDVTMTSSIVKISKFKNLKNFFKDFSVFFQQEVIISINWFLFTETCLLYFLMLL